MLFSPFLTDARNSVTAPTFTQRRFVNSPVEVTDNTAAFQLHFSRSSERMVVAAKSFSWRGRKRSQQATHGVATHPAKAADKLPASVSRRRYPPPVVAM